MPFAWVGGGRGWGPGGGGGGVLPANPITGDRTETTISAVRGLGERLVSGEGMADEWVVRGVGGLGVGAEAMCQRDSEHALTVEQALAVADLAPRIPGHFGSPPDCEWAIDADGELFL